MSDTKTSDESAASTLGGTELIRGVQSAANVKITVNQLMAAVLLLLADTDGTLAANSDSKIATQKAVKTFVAAQITAGLASADVMIYKGATDCSANPNYPAADAGAVYIVSVAGKIGGASGVVVEAGDLFVCKTDGTSSGNQATVGTAWDVVQTNLIGAALTSGTLAQFASTTSAQLATLLSDETGSGAAVFGTAPTLSNPVVGTQTALDNSTKAASTAYADAAVTAGRSLGINSQSTAYTAVLADANGCIFHPAADTTPRTFTIPANSSVAYPLGTTLTFDNDIGAGALTIAITTDTMVLVGAAGTTGSRTVAAGGQATALKVASTRWRINGTLLT